MEKIQNPSENLNSSSIVNFENRESLEVVGKRGAHLIFKDKFGRHFFWF